MSKRNGKGGAATLGGDDTTVTRAAFPGGALPVGAGVPQFDDDDERIRSRRVLTDDEQDKVNRAGKRAIIAVGTAFFLAELGDKTMLATITLATDHGWFGTWIGSTLGMVAADALAIVVGRALGKRLPENTIRIGAAVLFFVFGVWLGIEAITQFA